MTPKYATETPRRRPFRAGLLVSAGLTILIGLAAPVAFDSDTGFASWNSAFAQGRGNGGGNGNGDDEEDDNEEITFGGDIVPF